MSDEEIIKIDEYVRLDDGTIGKYDINKNGINVVATNTRYIGFDIERDVVKHSKNIIDLIKPGDILQIEEDGDIAFIGLEKDTTTLTYQEIIDEIKNKKVKLLSILTKEQYKKNCYRVEE